MSQRKRGFTLVELLVAISILSIAILAAFTAVRGSFQSNAFVEDQIIGSYLAQEGLEFVRNLRDENGIKNIRAMETGGTYNWLTGMTQQNSDPCYFGKTCTIDSPLKTLTSCSGAHETCPVLKFDSVSGLYGYTSGWASTKYTRSLVFTSVSATEVQATVTVSWSGQGITKSITVSELLKNWQ
jgi:prepilin-type N-terminal cleavage/methylation domain-containing protein